jgi:signal transduction histidine kinase
MRFPWFVQWRLRRRIFGAFAMASALSAGVAGFLFHHGVSPLWALIVAVVVMWGASGAIAWRLTMPLMELARVAKKIGEGELDARMRLPRGAHELNAIGVAVNDMAARIEKQLRDQRELLAAVSHEIRTPLGHLRVLLDTARDRGLPEDMLGELEREVLEVDALVDQLLASSRLDFGALDTRDLDVALESARALERLAVDASVLDVETEGCLVSADPTLLRSALANLVRNAVDHGGGVARLAVRRLTDTVEVEVDDRGPGFASDDLPHVFEPFYRGRGDGGSLGLGLSLVDRIARAHGGSAIAVNRDGGGARVTLRLPLAPARS